MDRSLRHYIVAVMPKLPMLVIWARLIRDHSKKECVSSVAVSMLLVIIDQPLVNRMVLCGPGLPRQVSEPACVHGLVCRFKLEAAAIARRHVELTIRMPEFIL